MVEEIKKIIGETLEKLGYESVSFSLEYPGNFDHGDYSTNVSLIIAKKSDVPPKEIADEIKSYIEKKLPKEIERVEVAGAGFINFFLTKDFFGGVVKNIVEGNNSKNTLLAGKKILFEYTDPNPFKPFHIGHLMSNSIGEALSRVAENHGADVKRLCYGGDVGLHVAKTIWGMMKERSAFPHDSDSLSDKVKFLGDSYVLGNNSYEDDENAKKEIKEINKKVFGLLDENVGDKDQEIKIYYEKGRKWSIEKFEEIYRKLGTKFDKNYYESEVASLGLAIVEKNIGEVFHKSDGAIVFKGEEHGLHTRVFVTSEGLPTYETKELGLFGLKNKDFPQSDVFAVVTANEQNDYFKVLSKVVSLLTPEIGSKIIHLSHGMLRFASGKMSSRKGNVILGEDLINEMEGEIYKKIEDRDLSQEEKKEIAMKVAVGAIKYSVLRQKPGKDIIFDREKALSFEGDSGPYLQYALVRAYSLLEKGKEEGVSVDYTTPEDWKTLEIEKMIQRFEGILISMWEEKAPQHLVEYLTQTASAFNSFYAEGKIVDKNDPTSPYRLAITKAFAYVMKNGLNILAISVLEKM